MMQSGGPDAADVHAGTTANGLEAFENSDVFGGIGRHGRTKISRYLSIALSH
jgi:hypothetical protein